MIDEFKTKKDLTREILNCAKDPIYFFTHYIKIQHPVLGLIPFSTFNYQNDLLEAFQKHRFNIVLKARQVGITTLIGCYIFWYIYFYQNKNVLVVATKQEVAKNIIRIIRVASKNLPKWLTLSKILIDNRQSIELNNGSRVKATTTASDVGRGEAVSLLIVDETAFVKNADQLWIGLAPVISTGGRAILASSPNGTGNLFHKLYQQAQNNENNFNCRFGTYINPNKPEEIVNDNLPWWIHPQHDLAWFENETRGKSRREVGQEFECSFASSGETFIFSEDLIRLEKQIKQPIERTNFDRNLWIWKYPVRGATYILAADISRGDSVDFSAFHILRIDTQKVEQVGEYKGKVTPDVLGDILVEASKKYNNAIIAVENNGGWAGQTILKIRQANYPFIYYTARRKHEFIDPYYAHFADPQSFNDVAIPGYSITPLNRIPMLAKMEQYVRLEQIELNSSRLLDEFRTFSWNNSRPEAQKGYNDDLVLSLCGAIWIREESFMNVARGGNNLNQALLAGMSVEQTTTRNVPQFNFNQSGIYDRNRIAEFVADQNKIIMSDGREENLNWLLDAKNKISMG